METLVWGLFLMIQNPERCTTPDKPDSQAGAGESVNKNCKTLCKTVPGRSPKRLRDQYDPCLALLLIG
jgi:hypothetical protein